MYPLLVEYLHRLFGASAVLKEVRKVSGLPALYPSLFQLAEGTINQIPCLFAVDRRKLRLTPLRIQKHLQFLSAHYHVPVVYVGELAAPHVQERLMAMQVPFVVPSRVLYLPFIGAVISRKTVLPGIPHDYLSCCAQLILLGVLLKAFPEAVSAAAATELLPFGKSSVFHALCELESFQLGKRSASCAGHEMTFQFNDSGRKLWEEAQEVLRNPCKRTVGLPDIPADLPLVIAGADALARETMLSEQSPTLYAVELAAFRKSGAEMIPAEATESRLQLWLYPPCIFGRDRIDPLSLALSLRNDSDERVQIALQTYMEKFPW